MDKQFIIYTQHRLKPLPVSFVYASMSPFAWEIFSISPFELLILKSGWSSTSMRASLSLDKMTQHMTSGAQLQTS